MLAFTRKPVLVFAFSMALLHKSHLDPIYLVANLKGGQKRLKKADYRIKNWREYNKALVNPGSLTFWFVEAAIAAWGETERTGRRGAPRRYSDVAVECALPLREVFHLPLRATEGLIRSPLELMGLPLPTPDYTLPHTAARAA